MGGNMLIDLIQRMQGEIEGNGLRQDVLLAPVSQCNNLLQRGFIVYGVIYNKI
jgi:hypothetical protein